MGSKEQSSQILGDLLFPKIFQTFRMSIQPSKLIIAFLALTILSLIGLIMDLTKTVVTTPYTQATETELQIYIANPDQLKTYIEDNRENSKRTGVYSTLWNFAGKKFHSAQNSLFKFNLPAVAANIADYFKAMGWALKYHTIYCVIFGIIKLAVIALAGGAICRITALQFAQGEKPGLSEAMRYSSKKFKSFFATPLVPAGIIIFTGLSLFVLGLIGNIPLIGELIIGLAAPFALIAGTLIAVILIGAVAGFNLMFPAIAYDGSDCFDAISRSFSYVYAKPWRMGFYTTIAAIYGSICYIFVRFFVFLSLLLTNLFLQFGVLAKNSSKEVGKLTAIWPVPTFTNLFGSSELVTTNWSESVAIFLVHLLLLITIGLIVSFVISFYFSANTIIYSLMRNRVDNTALEDVYTDFETELTDSEAVQINSNPQNSKE